MGILRMAVMRPAVQVKRILSGNFGQTRYTRYLETHQYDNTEKLREMQAEKLCIIMRHACERIPFYKHLKNDLGLVPETSFEDIKKFPVVTKQMIAECPNDFVDPDVPVLMRMKTGGTSKVKIEVLRDRYSLNMRNDEYFNRIIGIYPGMRKLILSRHEINYRVGNDEAPENMIHYYHNRISGIHLVKPMPLTEEKLSRIYSLYMSEKPEFLKGNLNTCYIFAKYLEEKELVIPPVKIIRSSGTQMVNEHQDTFKRVFGVEAYDSYGASEINFVSSQCEIHEGMHYIPMSHYIEIHRDNGEEANMEEPGSMIVTSLVHKAMPIIRYRIGDIAAMTHEQCPCGRTYPMIREIMGRELEIIETEDGRITGYEVLELLKAVEGISDIQLVEISKGRILLNIVKSNNYSRDDEEVVLAFIHDKTGIRDIQISFVPIIPILPNAKSIRVIPLEYYKKIDGGLIYYNKF